MRPGTCTADQEPARTFVEEARRGQIVEAAIAVIAAEGLERCSFARIAARAGVSPSLISYHFASKGDLMTSVTTSILEALDRHLDERLDGVESYPAALRALVEEQVRWLAAHPTLALALGRIEHAGRSPGPVHGPSALQERTVAELEAFFSAGQADGGFRAFDVRTVAVSLLASLSSVSAELARGADLEVVAGTLADVYERATSAAPAARRRRTR